MLVWHTGTTLPRSFHGKTGERTMGRQEKGQSTCFKRPVHHMGLMKVKRGKTMLNRVTVERQSISGCIQCSIQSKGKLVGRGRRWDRGGEEVDGVTIPLLIITYTGNNSTFRFFLPTMANAPKHHFNGVGGGGSWCSGTPFLRLSPTIMQKWF